MVFDPVHTLLENLGKGVGVATGTLFGGPGVGALLGFGLPSVEDLLGKAISGSSDHEGAAADASAAVARMLDVERASLTALDKQLEKLLKDIGDDDAATKEKLLKLKSDLEKALAEAEKNGNKPAAASALAQWMRDHAKEVTDTLEESAKKIEERKAALQNVGGQVPGNQSPGLTSPGLTDPGLTSPGLTDPGLTSPGLTSPGDMGYDDGFDDGGGASPLGDLASLLPQMGQSAPGLGGLGGVPGLSDLLGAAAHPDNWSHDKDDQKPEDKPEEKKEPEEKKPEDKPEEKKPEDKPEEKKDGNGAEPVKNETPAPTMVVKPDGTPAQATSAELAAAARAHFGGQSIEDAYRAAQLPLPPAGTPVKDSLASPAAALMGDLAVFKDRYVMMMGDNQVYLDGTVQPLSALGKLTGFLGFRRAPVPMNGLSAPAPAQQVSASSAAV